MDAQDGKNYMRDNHWICQSTDNNISFRTDVENNSLEITVHNVKA
jgi:hypothetical protein